MTITRFPRMFAVAATAFGLAASPALAADNEYVVTGDRAVPVKTLNIMPSQLSTPADVAAIENRIQRAANAVCEVRQARQLQERMIANRCAREAKADGMAQLARLQQDTQLANASISVVANN
ncbi:UrcA family protein [Pacificimonas sp. WHA3]|uniref:UrcA family protein n=1 Tax=Pacificimonas pallii TaxID=2827236 RepID=A0ABS6SFI6_9SPHN|nr:UrcA family protein [Pacificimonas pallii]MBV7257169.1 UrcA family protein [Pacificimonas pallii]